MDFIFRVFTNTCRYARIQNIYAYRYLQIYGVYGVVNRFTLFNMRCGVSFEVYPVWFIKRSTQQLSHVNLYLLFEWHIFFTHCLYSKHTLQRTFLAIIVLHNEGQVIRVFGNSVISCSSGFVSDVALRLCYFIVSTQSLLSNKDDFGNKINC